MISSDTIAQYSVMVNNGSVCLFNGASTEYLYVLTCRHNLKNDESPKVVAQYLDEKSKLVMAELVIIGTPFLHKDPNKDAAILKVKFVERPIQLLIIDNPIEVSKSLKLVGYPSVRDDKEYQFRMNDIKVEQTGLHGYIEATVEGNATSDEITGQSGGGVFFVDGDRLFVVGVQSRMAAKNEQLGRIEFMPISFFKEIIAEHSFELKELLPHYLYSFSFLKMQAMKLEGCIIDQNVVYTRGYLQTIAEEIIQSPITPLLIKDAFKERLIVHDQALHSLSEKSIWIAWLEFLIIMRIILDKHVTSAEIEDVFNNYRLIFSNTDGDWTRELPNIMRSNYEGLKKDGKVIISTKNAPVKPIIPKGLIVDLARACDIKSSEFKIDDGIGHPLKAYRLCHLHAFQKICIIDNETLYKDFSSLSEEELFNMLKTEFNDLFQQQ